MPILVYALTHKTAPIDVRERFALSENGLAEALQKLSLNPHVDELVVLSTCNRTEIYALADDTEPFEAWFEAYLAHTSYMEGEAAVSYMMRVASGLESMVLGEPQILGQMKRAYAVAQGEGTVGKYLSKLFHATFSAAKVVRTRTGIGEQPISMAFSAIKMTQHIFKTLQGKTALLVGSGEMIELAAKHLKEQGVSELIFVNRTVENAKAMAEAYGGKVYPLGELHELLPLADMTVSATASELPIIGKGSVEHALRVRKLKTMVMIDLGLPRDIEPEIKSLDNVYCYDIDDLQSVVQTNKNHRLKAAQEAERYIVEHAAQYMQWYDAQPTVEVVKAYRSHHEKLRDESLAKAQRALNAGKPMPEVLSMLAHDLTNKLLHMPTQHLKKLGEQDPDLLSHITLEEDK